MWVRFAKFMYKLLGWKVVGQWPDEKKFVCIAAPHTSSKDFPIGVWARAILGRQVLYVAKKEIFKPPLGWLFMWMGGYPVDRSKRNNFTDAVADIYNSKEEFAICIAPEGTRKKVDKLKSGYWYIAKGANVPITHVGMDWGNKQVIFDDCYYPTDIDADMKRALDFFKKIEGCVPELDLRHLDS